MCSHINVGSGIDIPIGELAKLIATVTGYTGEVTFDVSKPDGTPRKLMDSARLRSFGWQPHIELADGLTETYKTFKAEYAKG
jgi:GDP-L-fucose synthase